MWVALSSGTDHQVCDAWCKYSTKKQNKTWMLWAIQHFEAYVHSTPLPGIVFKDHNPHVFLNQMHNSTHQLVWWALTAQNFNAKNLSQKEVWQCCGWCSLMCTVPKNDSSEGGGECYACFMLFQCVCVSMYICSSSSLFCPQFLSNPAEDPALFVLFVNFFSQLF